jgi:ATP-dependent RNA helicase DeaD
MATIFIGAGSDAQIRPGDLVGAITGEARVAASDIGAIRVSRNHSLVQVQADRAESIIRALRNTTIKGRKVNVRPDRDTGDAPQRRGKR